MPRTIEDALDAVRNGRPLYLADGFGSAARVQGRRVPVLFPHSVRGWQFVLMSVGSPEGLNDRTTGLIDVTDETIEDEVLFAVVASKG